MVTKKVKPKIKPKPKAKAKKKVVVKVIKNPQKPIGIVSHYFSNIKVGVIKLKAPLNQGEQIRIMGGQDTDFKQKVGSMQVDHRPIKKPKKEIRLA